MQRLDEVLMGQASRGGAPPALDWMTRVLSLTPIADRRTLAADDLTRIDHYQGTATELHELLAAVLPLAHAHWYEAPVTAQHGTAMVMGYLAVPADDGVDVGWCCYAPAHGIIGPIGPVRVTATGMERPADLSAESWREIRSATGIILRALLLEL